MNCSYLTVCNLVSFDIRINSWDPLPLWRIMNISHALKVSSCPFVIFLAITFLPCYTPLFSGSHWNVFQHCRVVCILQDFVSVDLCICTLSLVCLLSPSIITSQFIHFVLYISSSFLFIAHIVPFCGCTTNGLFIHPSIASCVVSRFFLLWIFVYWYNMHFFLLGKYPPPRIM